jgi:hypothetical protein
MLGSTGDSLKIQRIALFSIFNSALFGQRLIHEFCGLAGLRDSDFFELLRKPGWELSVPRRG